MKESTPQSQFNERDVEAADNLYDVVMEVNGLMLLVSSFVDKYTGGDRTAAAMTTDECVGLHYLSMHIVSRLEDAMGWSSHLHGAVKRKPSEEVAHE